MDCTCLKHCLRRAFCKAVDGFSNRKASMTLVAFGMVILVCLVAAHFRPMEQNLPAVLGTIVGILTVFLTGHAYDQKWSPSPAPAVEKKDLPAVAKDVAKEIAKKDEDKEEGS